MAERRPIRTFRVPDSEWEAALAVARSEGVSLSEVLREALARFAAGAACPADESGEHAWARFDSRVGDEFAVRCSACGRPGRARVEK